MVLVILLVVLYFTREHVSLSPTEVRVKIGNVNPSITNLGQESNLNKIINNSLFNLSRKIILIITA
ncbi:MAG: hypothetical protein U9Q06_04665 [Nanoarchaeota archaeon]|nr:hypothetical protein [Nanoarchaeota archaeon]